MAIKRTESESGFYHVTARGSGKQLIFEDRADRLQFLSIMSDLLSAETIELHAWCLMGNHVHLLVRSEIKELSHFMRILLGRYARYFNERHGRVGHLFQERFKSKPVEDDAHLVECVLYIHLNPDKAGIDSFNNYEWSSYKEHLGQLRYCSNNFVEQLFDGHENYERSHRAALADLSSRDEEELIVRHHAVPDSEILGIGSSVVSPTPLADVKALPKEQRDGLLRALKANGLSARQIERITGISKSVVARA